MRKALIWCALSPLLLVTIFAGILPATVGQGVGALSSRAYLQQSQDAPRPPDSDTPTREKLSLSDQVIQQVLEPLRTGIEAQNIRQVLSVFDKEEFPSYANLQEQLKAFFRQYAEVRFRYQILQVTADNDHGSATADLEMDALPYDVTETPARRSVQMRFQMKLEAKGWKVTAFSPADFFSLRFSRADMR